MRRIAIILATCLVLPCLAQQKAESAPDLPWVPGKRWAIVVGAAGYEHYGKLNYADDDAAAIAETLVTDFRFEPDTVKLLTDKPDSKLKPTAGNIIGEIEDALANKTLTKSDMFVFFFAGHGVGTEKGDYLLPTDARPSAVERVGLPVSEVVERFTKAGLKNVLIIVDACRSGKSNPFGKQLQKLGRDSNIAVMLGCAPGARSYEDPTLKHGVFAYHLLSAMRDKELRDPVSGALWASSIGSWVKGKVKTFTERDYGDDAQDPYVWGNRADDVLIGAYVPQNAGPDVVKAFDVKAKGLTPKYYSAAMATFAQGLFDQGRFAECVEVMKTLEGLGELEPDSQYLLGTALLVTDRTSESSKAFQKLEQSPEPYWRNAAICANSTAPIPAERRLAAARAVWASDKTWLTGFMAWSMFISYGSSTEQQAFLKDFLTLKNLSIRRREYLRGSLESLKGDNAAALDAFRASIKDKGDSPEDNLLSMLMLPLLAELGKQAEMDQLIDSQIKVPAHSAFWLLLRATREKARGTAGWMQYVERAVRAEPTPDDLMHALKIAGKEMGSIREAVGASADRHPYSWKALAAKILCARATATDTSAIVEAQSEAERFAENKLKCRTAIFEMMQPMMEELFADGRLPAQKYLTWIDASWSMLFDYQDLLLQDYDSWWLIVEYGANSERFLQTASLAKRMLVGAIDAGTLRPNLASALMLAFMNVGDAPIVEKLYATVMKGGDTDFRARALYTIFLASQNRFTEADKIFKAIPTEDSDEFSAIGAWLDASLDRTKSAEEKLAKVTQKEGFVGAMCGLAWNALKQWDKAEPLLTQSRQNRSWGFMCVSARAFQVLWDHAVERKDTVMVNEMAHEALTSQTGNPLYASVGFEGTPNPKAFEGKYEWTVRGYDEDYAGFENATLTLTITAASVEGAFEDAAGKVMRVTGTLDAFGNLTAVVRGEGKEFSCHAKLAPHAIYQTYEKFKSVGQVFLLLDGKGARTVWLAKPKATQRLSESCRSYSSSWSLHSCQTLSR